MWKKYGKNFCVFIFFFEEKKRTHINLAKFNKNIWEGWNLPSKIPELEQIL